MKKREIRFGRKVLQLPCFFASVSSVKTNFSPKDYVEFLEEFGFPSYLVSAYDIINFKHGSDRLNNVQLCSKEERDSVVLLDSGNYEAYWLRDPKWNSSSYNKALETVDPDLFLSFDDAWNGMQVDLESSNYENKKSNDLIPIIHGTPMDIADKVIGTLKKKDWKIIAVPERELGDGIVQRAATLLEIRKKLEREGQFPLLHLLGTGNPCSILLYSACGADSFDGLEWCQTTVNPNNTHLVHFSQRDLFECDCSACTAGEDSYNATTLGHNLLFYIEWMNTIQKYLMKDEIKSLIEKYFSAKLIAKIGLE
jgi:queuine/archaeosine tRNA-ribosyltransferase